MNHAAVVRTPWLAALLGLTAGCGSNGSSPSPIPTPTPPPAQIDVGQLNMELLARVDVAALTGGAGTRCAGNWGYTAPDGRRFALTTTNLGLSIVEVTDPRHPRTIGLIAGPDNLIREVKTYRQYAYVTSEADGHGIDIIDLGDPDRPVKVQTWRGEFSNAHTLWIDTRQGLMFVNGASNRPSGDVAGMYIVDLERNPRNPRTIGKYDQRNGGYYIHDSYLRGNLLFGAAIFDGVVALFDVGDPAGIRRIGQFNTGCRFTHNAWPTDDGRYLFTTDERPNCPVETWDLQAAGGPVKVSQFIATEFGTPHNVLVDGSRLLVAHYSEGVHLLDITDPTNLRVLGRYDTTPDNRSVGCWSAYPFPDSNLIVASDIDGGLFVLGYTGS
jgi:choice-of-anchor B domain-containing protein